MEPHTEADPAGLLVSFLSEFGAIVGRGPHLEIDGSYHPLLIYPVLIGQSSKSRKGSSGKRIKNIYERTDPTWTRGRYKGTLSSGEGLCYAVRDAEYKIEAVRDKGQPTGETREVCIDEGVSDKRLFLVQSEFGSVLKVMAREGNSLSGAIRDSWDGEDLCPMTKGNRVRATSPHIVIVGHVTHQELLRHLTDTEVSNGFGNRFMWASVRRSKELPFSSVPEDSTLNQLVTLFRNSLGRSQSVGLIKLTEEAKKTWEKFTTTSQKIALGYLGHY